MSIGEEKHGPTTGTVFEENFPQKWLVELPKMSPEEREVFYLQHDGVTESEDLKLHTGFTDAQLQDAQQKLWERGMLLFRPGESKRAGPSGVMDDLNFNKGLAMGVRIHKPAGRLKLF